LVLLAVALAVPFLIPADRFRPRLVRLIEAQIGRTVEIDALRLYLLPTVRLRAVNLRVKNPEGLPPGDTVTVRSINVGVAPGALLSRKLEITGIRVNGVRVTLLRDATGRSNYDLSTPAAPRGAGAPFISLDRIGSMTVRNVEVTLSSYDTRRRQTTPSFTVTGLSARIQNIYPNSPDSTRRMEFASDLRGVTFSTPALARPVQFPKGALSITKGVGRGTFTAALGDIRAEGQLTVASLALPSVQFTVAVPELDVDKLNRLLVSRSSGGGPGSQAPRVERRLLARGDVKVNKLLLSPFEADRLHARLSVHTDTIEVDSYALSAYGGTIQGAAALDYAASSLPAVLTVKVRGVDLGRMVRATAPGARRVTGAVEADLRLATALDRDPKAALTGPGTFAVRNGSFQRLDLQSTLAKIAGAILNVPAGDTRFTYFGGDLWIERQRVYSNALRLQADNLEGTVRGSFGFNRTLDYTGTGLLKGVTKSTPSSGGLRVVGEVLRTAAQGVLRGLGMLRVPFSVSGSFDDPQFSRVGTPGPVQGESSQQPRRQTQQLWQQPQQRSPQD
ncbi:MAG: AsmA family protein, partial [Armatimonadetes bacterium]|nr:AsmA family protein [Armatimonadota bacterium]